MNDTMKEIVYKARQIHKKLNISSADLMRHLEYLQRKVTKKSKFVPCGCGNIPNISPSFARAFDSLTDLQQAHYYLKSVTLAFDILNNQSGPALENQTKATTWNFFHENSKQWQAKLIQIDLNKLTIFFRSTRQRLDLHNYIMRISKKKDKQKQIIALESTQKLQSPQTIRISNYKQNYQDFLKLLKTLMDYSMIANLQKINYQQHKTLKEDNLKALGLFKENQITQKTNERNNSINIKKSPSKELSQASKREERQNNIIIESKEHQINGALIKANHQSNQTQNFIRLIEEPSNLTLSSQGFIIHPQSRYRKIFSYDNQNDNELSLEQISNNLTICSNFTKWKKSIRESEILANISQNHPIFYQKHQFKNGSTVNYIYKRERIQRSKDLLYFIDTPTQKHQKVINGKIEYVIWKVSKDGNIFEITVQAKILHDEIKDKELQRILTDEFLGEFSYMFDQFQAKYKHTSSTQISKSLLIGQELTQSQHLLKSDASNILTFRHPMKPFKKTKLKLKHPSKQGEHPYFQNQYEFNQEGEMLCINEQKLKAQNSVLREVLKSIANVIFSSKTISTISLPISIFSVESNLSLLCKSYAYAPIFLQKATKRTDPVQRMKDIAVFAISSIISFLQMQKPFNPILGQTFQAIFDGCTIYGQQISHHPPISSVLMKGRGYDIFGSFEPKVSLGFNSIKIFHQGVLTISFDGQDFKKEFIKIILPLGQISGLAFGERKLNVMQKLCILDTKNSLFLEMIFGIHRGKTDYCKFYDGLEGVLVKIASNKDLNNFPTIDKRSFVEQYGTICGRWDKEIYYQNQLLFDSWTEMPCQYEKYPCPLPSDSFLREDLNFRMDKDFDSAATAKERLQQIQRNDNKLRKKNGYR